MKKRGIALALAAAMLLGGCSSGREASTGTSQAPSSPAESSGVSESAPETTAAGTTEAGETAQDAVTDSGEPAVEAD